MKTIHSRAYAVLLRRLREGRKAAGLSQDDLARRLGMPQSFVSKYENAERRLDILEYLRIALEIGLDPGGPLREAAGYLGSLSRRAVRRND